MMALFIGFLALFLTLFDVSYSNPCPNTCSGHGRCQDKNRICDCFEGYEGPDCSLISCPKSTAWFDIATATDTAHALATCSNMGKCDFKNGLCECEKGFEGNACERLSCPSSCNTRGDCLTMQNYALAKDHGTGTIYSYSNIWDADKIQGCQCTHPSSGPDCGSRLCPEGDDPLTTTDANNALQTDEVQTLNCKLTPAADDATNGAQTYFTLAFRQATTKIISYKANADTIRAALEELPTISQVTVDQPKDPLACSDGVTGVTRITFTHEFGNLPSLVLKTYGEIDIANTGISITTKGTKESLACSDRGVCNRVTGVCACADGFDTSDGRGSPGDRGDCGFGASLTCPSENCGGRGYCDESSKICACFDGFTGADCSKRECRKGPAWFEFPSAVDSAHVGRDHVVECSNAGICDTSTGICECLPNYEGSACERLRCAGGASTVCKRNGQCLPMRRLALHATLEDGEPHPLAYGSIAHDPKTWDADMIQGCYCDEGYTGYDCSDKLCATGDNPDTIDQIDEEQIIWCQDTVADVTKQDAEYVILTFRGEKTAQIPGNSNAATVKAKLEALTGIETVDVALIDPSSPDQMCTPSGNKFLIKFRTEHGNLPMLKLLKSQDINGFDIQLYKDGTKEQVECSDRGICDRTTGKCQCFTGYGASDNMGGPGANRNCGYREQATKRGIVTN